MAKPAEFVDKGRRCHECHGPGWMQRYAILGPEVQGREDRYSAEVDFHDTCIGSWLMANHGMSVRFAPGEVKP